MTGNHLLLYRFAELMLEHEQHILPVDLLFDDEQIGDFVKSIQIDSPYQQMLLEGVLTESVRYEILYVSFTVEGYFHYVLGEVIEGSIKNLPKEKQIEKIQNRTFLHFDFGLSYYFLKRINDGDSEPINTALEFGCCSVQSLIPAIIQSMLIRPEDNLLFKHDNIFLWKSVINRLYNLGKYDLIEPLLNKLKKEILKELLRIEYLPHLTYDFLNNIKVNIDNTLLKLAACFYLGSYQDVISIYESYKSEVKFKSSDLLVVASAMIDSNKFESAIDMLRLVTSFEHDVIELLRLESIAYNGIQMNDTALAKITLAISKSRELNGSYHLKTAELLNLEGLYLLSNCEFQKSINSFKISGKVFKKIKGEICFDFATSVNNIGLVYYYQNNFKEAMKNWDTASSILKIYGMGNHPESATIHKNTAFCHAELGEIREAKTSIKTAISIFHYNGLKESEVAVECEELLKKLNENDL
jgi:tetratricopeptide (TPR) repeat protein